MSADSSSGVARGRPDARASSRARFVDVDASRARMGDARPRATPRMSRVTSWTTSSASRRRTVTRAKDKRRKQERAAARKEQTASRRREVEDESADADEDAGTSSVERASGGGGESNELVFKALELGGSYKARTGRKLLEGNVMVHDAAKALFRAPFACASHDGNDVFDYGNKAALGLFEMSWDEFVGMRSTKSAAEDDGATQAERRALLDRAAERGVIENYSGVRVSSTGKKFRIQDATVWTISDGAGRKIGQAVRFDRVTRLNDDGSDGDVIVVNEEGDWVPYVAEPEPPAPEPIDVESVKARVATLEDEIKAQGNRVRGLKDGGATNDDPVVQAEVEVLKKLKSELASELEKIAAA